MKIILTGFILLFAHSALAYFSDVVECVKGINEAYKIVDPNFTKYAYDSEHQKLVVMGNDVMVMSPQGIVSVDGMECKQKKGKSQTMEEFVSADLKHIFAQRSSFPAIVPILQLAARKHCRQGGIEIPDKMYQPSPRQQAPGPAPDTGAHQ